MAEASYVKVVSTLISDVVVPISFCGLSVDVFEPTEVSYVVSIVRVENGTRR